MLRNAPFAGGAAHAQTMSRGERFAWRKLSAARWEDVWVDRLSEFRDRLAIVALAGSQSIRLEAYELTRAQADRLVKTFGGQKRAMKAQRALHSPAPRPPIKVRDKLVVVATEAERKAASSGGRKILLIPAGMAFGTGDHATTSTCLRLLADVSDELADQPWEMLDLGCGSGILALAAREFGARRAEAGDFDPDSVRTTKENATANGIRNVTVRRLDVLKWTPTRTWPIVAANMYSSILIQSALTIVRAIEPSGRLIFSGILREQEREVVAAFRKAGLRIEKIVRKGKWITGLAMRA